MTNDAGYPACQGRESNQRVQQFKCTPLFIRFYTRSHRSIGVWMSVCKNRCNFMPALAEFGISPPFHVSHFVYLQKQIYPRFWTQLNVLH